MLDADRNLNRLEQAVIVGCGRVGCQLGRLWRDSGLDVSGLVRTREKADRLVESGLHAMQADLDDEKVMLDLPFQGAVVYYSVPPPDKGVEDTRIQRFLSGLDFKNRPAVLVYLGTTGVYGQCHGAWVTEGQVPNPQSPRSKRRLHAETQLVDWHRNSGVPVVILRISGIYGPGRLPLESLRRRQAILNEADSPFSNRIHADDLTSVCRLAAIRATSLHIYNISDGAPCKMATYYDLVARSAGLEQPPTLSWQEAETVLAPSVLEFLRESRRIDNRKMLAELGVVLKYPTLTQGLQHCSLN